MIIVTLIITFIAIITSIIMIINYLFNIIIIVLLSILIIYDFLLRKWSSSARRNSPWKHPYVIGDPVLTQCSINWRLVYKDLTAFFANAGWLNDHLAPHLFPQKKLGDFFEYLILFITLVIHLFFIVFHILFHHPKNKKMGTPTTALRNCLQLYPTTAPVESFNGEVGDLRKRFVQQCLQDLQRSVVPWPLVSFHPWGEWFFFWSVFLGEI